MLDLLHGYEMEREVEKIDTMSPKNKRAKVEFKCKASELNREKIDIVSKDAIYHFEPDVFIREGKRSNGFDKYIKYYMILKDEGDIYIELSNLIGDGEIVKFSTISNKLKSASKFDILNIHNILIDVETPIKDYISDYGFTEELMRQCGLCVDLECSGKSSDGFMMWRLFNSLKEVKEHYRSQHNNGNGCNKIIQSVKTDVKWKILCIQNGCLFYFYYVLEDMYRKYDIS
jgi:hypothetical protein